MDMGIVQRVLLYTGPPDHSSASDGRSYLPWLLCFA